MQTPAVGEGPIAFVDADGKQHAIPLTAVKFVDGVVQSDVVLAGLQEWLTYLAVQGRLVAGPSPAEVEAMVLEAKNDGPTGNDIIVEVRTIGPVVQITVTETHVYDGLSFDPASERSVQAVLDASEKGIVHHTEVTGASTDVPIEGLVLRSKLAPDDREGWILKNSGGTKLAVLEPRGTGWDKGLLTVLVDDVDPSATTFSLRVAWEITSTVGAADLTGASPLADLRFAVNVSAPAPGGALRLPKPCRVALGGGAARVPATGPTKAHVTLLTDEHA